LSQHDVAGDQMTDWRKTPTNFRVSSVVHLMHVRHNAMVDTVTLPAVAAGYLEISRGVELCALLSGEPASQKAQSASLATIFARKYFA
jgi:hypothetical protein